MAVQKSLCLTLFAPGLERCHCSMLCSVQCHCSMLCSLQSPLLECADHNVHWHATRQSSCSKHCSTNLSLRRSCRSPQCDEAGANVVFGFPLITPDLICMSWLSSCRWLKKSQTVEVKGGDGDAPRAPVLPVRVATGLAAEVSELAAWRAFYFTHRFNQNTTD